jgi:homoaconitate hydratase
MTVNESKRNPPMNVIEKILCHHAVGLSQPFVKVGDVICVKADWTLASELTFQGMDTMYSSIGRPKIHRPDRFWLAIDHTVDPRVNELPKQKALIKLSTDFAQEHGLTDFWGPNTTIMHTEFARKRAQPGQIVIGADSHTCSAGGMGSFAAGLGAGDVVMPLVTGQTWFKVPEVVYIEFIGEPQFGIGGKDIILHILGVLKRNTVAFERAVYFDGEGVKYLSDDARFSISNMSTEFGAIAGVFCADEITSRVLAGRDSHNDEALFFRPDEGCHYAAHHVIDLKEVQQLIALYPSPDNCVPVLEKIGMKLDGCFIGACTTTQEDLILGALVLRQAMLEGKKPFPKGNRRVTPGSREIVSRLTELGLIQIYEQAGFTVGVPSCSYCVGIGADVAGENEIWLSSQNRNFRNRMGKGSIGNLASAACVAASSFEMEVTDPMPYIAKISREEFDRLRNWLGVAKDDFSAGNSYKITEPTPELVNDSMQGELAAEQAAVAALESALPPVFKGKVQKFGDNIDTDAVIPAQFMGLNKSSPLWPKEIETEEEFLGSKSFAYVRPEFVPKVKQGYNIIVAGTGFGSGSSREEAARCLKAVGVQAVIAKSFAYIYARNQPNNALLGIVVTDEKFHELAQEGEEVCIDLRNRCVTVGDHKVHFTLTQLEENFLNGGGLKNLFKRYKTDLFRASMRRKGAPTPISSADVGCGSSSGDAGACGGGGITDW